MRLSAPKKITWWIAVIVGLLGILAHIIEITILSSVATWMVGFAFVLLALAAYFRDL
jgi:hypothetical protein